MEPTIESRRLQACINDLVSVVALPAMWTGQDPSQLVGTLLDAVVGMMRLDFACAWLKLEGSAPYVATVRLGESGSSSGAERQVANALDRWVAEEPSRWPPTVRNPVGAGEVSLVPLRLGIRDDIGVIVAASTRAGFPHDTERLLLSVAANQAAIGLHEARLLTDQKRIAKELDLRVAERTRELAAANEELRRITDAIPHAILVLAPDGSVVYVNAFVLAYAGLSVDVANAETARESIFHPDDLERVLHEREVGLARGEPFESELRARRKDGQYRWFLVRYRPLRGASGDILRWYATATDIEDRRRTEERVRNENLALRDEIDRSSMFEEIVGSSRGLRRVLAQVAKVAPTDSTVLIVGETGTGKELIARAIHKRSSRAGRAFIRVNCAAIPPSLVASELFGHEKGAFTGALHRRVGRFEAADGGTIFLDEVGDLPADTQVALLRVLQEREFERVGSSRTVSVDVRVLAATHRDLAAAVKAGSFREDLFYRLDVFPLEIPPLRERQDDILLLVRYMIERYAKKAGKRIKRVDEDTLEMFRAYAWPGNVRELQNVIERAVILSDGDTFVVEESWFRREASQGPAPSASLTGTLAASERELIEAALAACKGRVSGEGGAAARLGIPRQTLESKIRALHIDRYRFRTP
ncbi:sigma-54 interaction domain-containing protein [Anaeromyxobacter oryzae]|uniref:Fis family transcriptional regulator n=1 Tax=Anaeromyxobacter oryzae TaxID=2918170 RepID=A0ABM7WZU9_9BACT|nr:sigma 54-interacting transcriptional regulator [Anaeromyxobacter oryzae]BDG05060.1 Fis family transcriptional regulator [Anaeromyxobacter oryzae]